MIARGYAPECAALLDLRAKFINPQTFEKLNTLHDELSKMLYALLNRMK
jgi:hypothetical protein